METLHTLMGAVGEIRPEWSAEDPDGEVVPSDAMIVDAWEVAWDAWQAWEQRNINASDFRQVMRALSDLLYGKAAAA